ncbi:MAG: serine O-acetyltransferase [Clostridiales bacterium]|nr:serine O-acetyltransferase [Clostridiales bacterium]
MNDFTFQNELPELVKSITDNYREESIFLANSCCPKPNRSEIIGIIREIRELMFPGYFAAEQIREEVADYYVGQRLNNLYEKLTPQITRALIHEARAKGEVCFKKEADCKERATQISLDFMKHMPQIQKLLVMDVQAAYDGDPAAQSKEQIIFSYPGLYAIFVYRFAHILYQAKVPYIPRIMTEYAHSRTGIDINAGAVIGKYFFIDHGTGVVIGETAIIGDNVKIYQGVTIGALSTRGGQALANVKRHPTIEDNVTIYSGASILGGETVIGEGSVIGGNAFITKSVPKRSRVSIKNPELNIREDLRNE